jgi:hypothetical protein
MEVGIPQANPKSLPVEISGPSSYGQKHSKPVCPCCLRVSPMLRSCYQIIAAFLIVMLGSIFCCGFHVVLKESMRILRFSKEDLEGVVCKDAH